MSDRATLTDLGRLHGTDKALGHGYTDFYERLIGHLRDRPMRLLEFGIGGYSDSASGGESLRMWRDYFPHAEIIGVDIFDKSAVAGDRITILQGDQSDRAFLSRLGREHGPFDVVIDDGSHVPDHVIITFEALFPHVVDGGYYFVEDIQTSYWPSAGGRLRPRSNRSSMAYFKRRVDGLNFVEFRVPGYRPTAFDRQIDEISFRHNAVAVRKGDNAPADPVDDPHPIPYGFWVRRSTQQVTKRLLRRLKRRR